MKRAIIFPTPIYPSKFPVFSPLRTPKPSGSLPIQQLTRLSELFSDISYYISYHTVTQKYLSW